jgi:hypothetical protein
MTVSPENLDQEKYALELKKYNLEWWKLGVSVLTPVIIVAITGFLTYAVNSWLNQEQSKLRQREQILSEKQKAYAEIGRGLNIIYAFAADIGDFYEYNPLQITSRKGEVDRVYYMYCIFWSRDTRVSYNEFMSTVFEMYGPFVGRKARIFTTLDEKHLAWRIHGNEWNREWDSRVTGNRGPFLKERYNKLVRLFMEDITMSTLNAELCQDTSPSSLPETRP